MTPMDCSPDGNTVRRLHPIHLVLIGVAFAHVVRDSRRSERTVRFWVRRFDTQGFDGITFSGVPGGAFRRLRLAGNNTFTGPLTFVPGLSRAGAGLAVPESFFRSVNASCSGLVLVVREIEHIANCTLSMIPQPGILDLGPIQ